MLSIIIPAYNEGSHIKATLESIRRTASDAEIIVVDGGSTDATRSIAKRFGKVIRSMNGRAIQMNAGAKIARGDVLYFLHADSIPPQDVGIHIGNALQDRSVVGGGFLLRYDSPRFFYRLVECSANTRIRLFKVIFGDQSMFVRRSVFDKIGGFPSVTILEDVEFSQKLKRMGRVEVIDCHVTSSPRRFEQGGQLRVYLRMVVIMALYLLGCPPHKLRWLWRTKSQITMLKE